MSKTPWLDEPDQISFLYQQTRCIIKRNKAMGHLCGYVGLKPRNQYYKVDLTEAESQPHVHGGVTWCSFSQELDRIAGVNHKPCWWVGFDCAHSGDYRPYSHSNLNVFGQEQYRTVQYVKDEIYKLCNWLNDTRKAH